MERKEQDFIDSQNYLKLLDSFGSKPEVNCETKMQQCTKSAFYYLPLLYELREDSGWCCVPDKAGPISETASKFKRAIPGHSIPRSRRRLI